MESNIFSKLLKIKGYLFILILLILIFTTVLIVGTEGQDHNVKATGYLVKFNGQALGMIEKQEDADGAIEIARIKLQDKLQKNIIINVKPTLIFEEVNEGFMDINTLSNDIYEILESDTLLYAIQGYDILVNSVTMAFVEEKATAEEILNTIKSTYIDEENIEDLVEAEFVDKVEMKLSYRGIENVLSKDEALDKLQKTDEVKKTYTVKKGDTLSGIAYNHNIELDELVRLNPDISNSKYLQIDDEITLVMPKPLISIQTIKRHAITEVIPKPITYDKNSKQYTNYKKTIQEGSDGKKEIIFDSVSVNGLVEEKVIISEKVIEEPIETIIEVGTKPLPLKSATGTFQLPINGRLTSSYGPRWNSVHRGIDLASASGNPVKAADGGTVVFAGWSEGNGYGLLVKIDHGNGYISYYAHNSKIYVKKGQKVAKGETIAAVGSTGKSTGPHVHFEIRKNGKAVNPYNYVK